LANRLKPPSSAKGYSWNAAEDGEESKLIYNLLVHPSWEVDQQP
jgi:hypothetical protein